jgi:CheY-like chemotaxis protein
MGEIGDIHAGVIADRDGMGRVLGDLLRFAGMRHVLHLATPSDQAARLAQCDVVIAALDAGGLDLITSLRRADRSPNPYIPIVLVGVDVRLADVQAAIQFGAHDVLALPLSSQNVRARLARTVFAGRPWISVAGYFGPCRRRVLRPWAHTERRAGAEADRAAREAAERRAAAMGWS